LGLGIILRIVIDNRKISEGLSMPYYYLV